MARLILPDVERISLKKKKHQSNRGFKLKLAQFYVKDCILLVGEQNIFMNSYS